MMTPRGTKQSTTFGAGPLMVLLLLSQSIKVVIARPMPRIIGGEASIPGTYPFFASLTIENSHSCGGTLVAPDIILSAAHCVGLERAEVGRSVRTDPNDTYETFDLIQEIRHPVYNDEDYKYDFMILKLDRPASDQFKPIRLNQDETLPQVGIAEGVKAIGFGVTEYFYDGSHSGPANILQEVGLQVITNEECSLTEGGETTDAAFASGYAGLITPDMLCAWDDNQDTCFGDSGGPLMIQEWDEYILVGVTSWGFGCGDNTFPGVYSRVSNQYQWIKKNVCDLSVNPPAEFECDAPVEPVKEVQVTIALTFDDFPGETSFLIIDDSGFGVTLVEFPADSFTDASPKSTFYHTLTMKESSTYTFIISDSGGDGLCCYEPGSYLLYVGTESEQGEVLVSGEGNFGQEMSHQFTVPVGGENEGGTSDTTPPSTGTLAPSVQQTVSETPAPTTSPTTKPTVPPTNPPSPAPSAEPSSGPTITPSPTPSPTKPPTESPTSTPTLSMSPSEFPTSLPQPLDKTQRNSIILGVFVVVIVAGMFLATSWYADRHSRLHKVQPGSPLIESDDDVEELGGDPLLKK